MFLSRLVLTPFIALLFLASPGDMSIDRSGEAQAAVLGALGGTWRGGGKLRLEGGRSKRLRCRAYYNPKAGGKRLGMAIRCASTSYKIELRSQLAVAGNRVTGSWEERNFNATGSLFRSSRPGRLTLSVSGSVKAKLFVTYGGRRQTVRLTVDIGGFREISLALRR